VRRLTTAGRPQSRQHGSFWQDVQFSLATPSRTAVVICWGVTWQAVAIHILGRTAVYVFAQNYSGKPAYAAVDISIGLVLAAPGTRWLTSLPPDANGLVQLRVSLQFWGRVRCHVGLVVMRFTVFAEFPEYEQITSRVLHPAARYSGAVARAVTA
jgi:hypothetical protein